MPYPLCCVYKRLRKDNWLWKPRPFSSTMCLADITSMVIMLAELQLSVQFFIPYFVISLSASTPLAFKIVELGQQSLHTHWSHRAEQKDEPSIQTSKRYISTDVLSHFSEKTQIFIWYIRYSGRKSIAPSQTFNGYFDGLMAIVVGVEPAGRLKSGGRRYF